MTEFTKEDIEYYRKQYALWTSRRQTTPEELHLTGRLRDALDHIEYLQAENDKLKAENERLREGLMEIANSAGIDACGYTTGEGHSDCIWKARKALKEVTK
jgi:hypothetical protein